MFKSYEFYSIPSKIFHSAQTLNSQSTFWVQNHYCRSGSGSSTSSVDQVLVLENQQCRSGSCSSTSSVDQVLVLKSSVDQVLVLVLVVQKRSGPSTSIVYIRFWYLQCTSGSGSSTSSVDQVLVLVLVVQIRFWFQLYQCISGSCSRTSTVLQTRFWFQYKYYSVDQCISAVRISGSGSRISSAYQVLVLVLVVYIRFWFSYQQCISGSGSRIISVYQVLVLVLVVYIRFLVLLLVVYIRFWFLYQQRTSAPLQYPSYDLGISFASV